MPKPARYIEKIFSMMYGAGKILAGQATAAQKGVEPGAWPVMIANLSLPLAGAVDTAVVGHLPDPQYIGAVALGALIFSWFVFPVWFF